MTRLALAFKNRLYTLDEFEQLDYPFDDDIYELIDGAIVVSSPSGGEEALIKGAISYALEGFVRPRKLGRVWIGACFRVAPGFGPSPDVAFMKAARVLPVTTGAVAIAPDLAVEIWSPRDLDTKKHREEARRKIRRYQVAGVSLVWAINPANRTIEVYHPDQTDPVQVLGENEVLSGEDVLPGFEFPVKALFPLE